MKRGFMGTVSPTSHFLMESGSSQLWEHVWQKDARWITTWRLSCRSQAAAEQSERILPCSKRAFLRLLASVRISSARVQVGMCLEYS
eukprot:3851062-Rhodomonas_salina.1